MQSEQAEKVRFDVAVFLARLVVGWVFVFHGAQKLFGVFGGPGLDATAEAFGTLGIPAPTAAAFLAGAAEFLGGILLMIGFLVRWAAVPLTIVMVVAITQAHTQFSGPKGGYEFPLVLGVVTFGLGLTGAGRISLGAFLGAMRKGTRRGPKLDTAVANIRQ